MKIDSNKHYYIDKDKVASELSKGSVTYRKLLDKGYLTYKIQGLFFKNSPLYDDLLILNGILVSKSWLKIVLDSNKHNKTNKKTIKSDGGSSDYYKIVLPKWLLDKQQEKGFIMLEDIAEVLYNNDFNYTNTFKAQCRMFALESGTGKEGNTFEYDANKCKYYVDKQVEVFNR